MAANGDATGTESAIEETSEYTTQHPTSSQTHVPSAAKWLGALGAIPFVSLAVADYFLEGPFQEQVSFALAAYGAVILSFLGGIHFRTIANPLASTEFDRGAVGLEKRAYLPRTFRFLP